MLLALRDLLLELADILVVELFQVLDLLGMLLMEIFNFSAECLFLRQEFLFVVELAVVLQFLLLGSCNRVVQQSVKHQLLNLIPFG